MPPLTKTNGLAIASMVLGIVWIWWIGSLLAIIFGGIAIKQINESERLASTGHAVRQTGKGMAIAGLVLGLVGAGTFLLFLIAAAAQS